MAKPNRQKISQRTGRNLLRYHRRRRFGTVSLCHLDCQRRKTCRRFNRFITDYTLSGFCHRQSCQLRYPVGIQQNAATRF